LGEVCLNGGSCVRRSYGDTNLDYHCDCSTSFSASNEESLYVAPYTGRYCEVPVETICDQELTTNGYLFCTNKGTCKGQSYLGCNCPEGRHGAACEFDTNNELFEDGYGLECNTHCKHGGICRKGAKSMTFIDTINNDVGDLSLYRDSYNSDFEHCVCPPGYMGLHCETEVQVCGSGDAVADYSSACLHGAPCVETNERNDPWKCDCSRGTFSQLAGEFCQHKKTTNCGTSPNAFCTNEGSCKSVGNDEHEFEGCTCKPPFVGFHCENVWSEADCDLDCGPFGECRPAPERDGTNVCLCHLGHTGDVCETRVDTCAGGHEYCYHGGECIVGELDEEQGMFETWCNCSTAVNEVDGTQYDGAHCQLPISDICEEPVSVAEERASVFEDSHATPKKCYNGGTCKTDGSMECDCLETFSGSHCETENPDMPPKEETAGADGDGADGGTTPPTDVVPETEGGDDSSPSSELPDDLAPLDLGDDLRPVSESGDGSSSSSDEGTSGASFKFGIMGFLLVSSSSLFVMMA